MKRLVMAVAFGCVLSGSATAGVIPSTDVTSPTAADNPPTTTVMSPGDIPNTDCANQRSDATLSGLLALLGLAVG